MERLGAYNICEQKSETGSIIHTIRRRVANNYFLSLPLLSYPQITMEFVFCLHL